MDARPGQPVNLTEVREEIKALKAEKGWYIAQVAYDPYQLEMMMEELGRVMWTEAFNQQSDREKSDKLLYDLITQGRLAHDGNHPDLKQHLQNADRKLTGDDRKMRIVKREETAKVDLAVATSMACYRCLVELNL
jgi:phage terminase large subunit-like protein